MPAAAVRRSLQVATVEPPPRVRLATITADDQEGRRPTHLGFPVQLARSQNNQREHTQARAWRHYHPRMVVAVAPTAPPLDAHGRLFTAADLPTLADGDRVARAALRPHTTRAATDVASGSPPHAATRQGPARARGQNR